MDVEPQKQLWEEKEEEEEDNKSTVQPHVNSRNEHAEEEEPEQNTEINDHNHAAEQNEEGDTPKQGNESADGASGMHHTGLQYSVFGTNSKDEFDIQRVISAEISHYRQRNLGGEILPCSSPAQAKDLSEEESLNLEHLGNKTGVDTDVDLIEEIEQEPTDFDIERLFEKQSTHDLYCANFASCMTKRVILRRRKQNTVLADNLCPNDTSTPAADEVNVDKLPVILRCLSCLGLFIPTGDESADEVSEMHYNGFESSVNLETNSKDEELHIKANEFDIQRVVADEINDHYQKDSGHEILLCSSPSPAKELCDKKNTHLVHLDDKTRADTDVGLVEENDQEFTKFDVERVLEKQSTHDFYCANCHSCITRRVILRRRKQSTANALKTVDEQRDYTLNIYSNYSPALAADEENFDREAEVFRCLSPFSLFIPTGNTFKIFGFRDSNENGEKQDVQIPSSNKNSFTSIFAQADGAAMKPEVSGIYHHNSSYCTENILSYQGRCTDSILLNHVSDHDVAPDDDDRNRDVYIKCKHPGDGLETLNSTKEQSYMYRILRSLVKS